MARPTKKELRLALVDYRKAAERYALGLMTGGKDAPWYGSLAWRGLTIKISIVRRSRIVCGVPAPYSCFELWHEAEKDGKMIIQTGNGASFIDAVFHRVARGALELEAVPCAA